MNRMSTVITYDCYKKGECYEVTLPVEMPINEIYCITWILKDSEDFVLGTYDVENLESEIFAEGIKYNEITTVEVKYTYLKDYVKVSEQTYFEPSHFNKITTTEEDLAELVETYDY